ncbi:MAG: anthranilate synthase component I family protein [Candidatus Limnocylindrales bacterium]
MNSSTDPLSLAEAKRQSAMADTVLLRATRSADLETPIGAFLRLDDGTTPAYLLESVEGGERLGRYSFLGIGPRRLLEVRDGRARIQDRPVGVLAYAPDLPIREFDAPDPLQALREFIPRRRVAPRDGMPRFTGGAVGALAYDAISAFEPSVPLPEADPVGVPAAAFIETDLVIVFDHLTHTLSAIASLHTESPDFEGRYRIAEAAIFEALERTSRPSAAELAGASGRSARSADRGGNGDPSASGAVPESAIESSLGRDQYIHAVEVAKDAIAAGEAIQVVLARRQSFDLPVDPATGAQLDGIGLYRSLRRVNPSPYLFFTRVPGFEVVGASPELLVQLDNDKLTTHPIAGTRPRGADAREDAILAEQLQRDPKERAEHVMLVDLGRNDLGRVARAGTVTVSKYMEVERYSHVLHLVSHVEARLKPDLDALDALRAVFPAGTLSGAPKIRAMQLIAAAEKERRGLYGGAVGYLGYDGNLDTAITIRSAVLKDGRAHIHTGAGIVAGSVPAKEFEETEHKAGALRRAIELAAGPGPQSRGSAPASSGTPASPITSASETPT